MQNQHQLLTPKQAADLVGRAAAAATAAPAPPPAVLAWQPSASALALVAAAARQHSLSFHSQQQRLQLEQQSRLVDQMVWHAERQHQQLLQLFRRERDGEEEERMQSQRTPQERVQTLEMDLDSLPDPPSPSALPRIPSAFVSGAGFGVGGGGSGGGRGREEEEAAAAAAAAAVSAAAPAPAGAAENNAVPPPLNSLRSSSIMRMIWTRASSLGVAPPGAAAAL